MEYVGDGAISAPIRWLCPKYPHRCPAPPRVGCAEVKVEPFPLQSIYQKSRLPSHLPL